MEYPLSPITLEAASHMATYSPAQDVQLQREQLVGLIETEGSYTAEYVPCQQAAFRSEDDSFPLEEWRRKICQWAFRVIDHFRLDREVVSVGMNIFDRFLVSHRLPQDETRVAESCSCTSCKKAIDSGTFQLAAMTSIYMAIKIHSEAGSDDEFSRRKHFKLSAFVELSRGQFTSQDIVSMEQTILATLSWKVTPPTPMALVSYLLTLMPSADLMPSASVSTYNLVLHVLQELSRYLTELAVCLDSSMSSHRPSRVAFAAILVSMDLLTTQALPLDIRDVFSREVFSLCGCSDDRAIQHLRTKLSKAVWPEMLFDGCDAGNVDHPITMAREFGLLDFDQIYRGRRCTATAPSSPPASPTRVNKAPIQTMASWNGSPVSVARR